MPANSRDRFRRINALKKAKPVEPANETEKRIIAALWRTWNAVAHDFLNVEGCEGPVSGGELQDCVPDYLSMYGDDKEAEKAFNALSDTRKDEILEMAFPKARKYGN